MNDTYITIFQNWLKWTICSAEIEIAELTIFDHFFISKSETFE